MVMGEVIPGIAAFAVVLPHRAPLPLAQIRSPFLPRDSRLARLVQAFLLVTSTISGFMVCLRCSCACSSRFCSTFIAFTLFSWTGKLRIICIFFIFLNFLRQICTSFGVPRLYVTN